jgi:hypothetical protein
MGVAHVASIHWWPYKIDRKQFGFGVFEIPAVKLGDKPFILEVKDKIQVEQGPYQDSNTKRVRSIKRFPETGQVIARDIVNHCTTNGNGMTAGCHPGIWVVRESVPDLHEENVIGEDGRVLFPKGTHKIDADGGALWKPATAEQKAAMWAEDLEANTQADAAYIESLCAYWDSQDPKKWRFIPPMVKAGAKQYSLTKEWNSKAGALERVACPHCGEQIVKVAAICRFCTRVVDPARNALNEERLKNFALKNGGNAIAA